jgi:hypothetical protein
MTINFTPTLKQHEVFKLFDDKESTEILFGGGVGSAKTYLMCALLTIKCLQYPNIVVGLGRNVLKVLKKTTLETLLFKVFPSFGIMADRDYKYNPTLGVLTFNNGSKVYLMELAFLPSDPDYLRFSGLEFTFVIIDEANETNARAKEIIQSRIGRGRNKEYGIKPMLLMTCNPGRNFLYEDFYVADKEGTMPYYRKFVSANAFDNPHLDQAYIDNLKRTMSSTEVSRLLYGNWEVTDDVNGLVSSDDVLQMYDLSINHNTDRVRYISTDIAFKQDGCILFVWEGNDVIDIIKVGKDEIVLDKIKDTAIKYNVQTRHIAYDSDGVGQFIKQYLRTAKAIVNNGRPMKGENYINLKAQLYYKLGEMIRDGNIKIKTPNYKKELESELLCIKRKDRTNTSAKMEINSKDDQKKIIGHSPDYSDAMMFKMIFQYTTRNPTRML